MRQPVPSPVSEAFGRGDACDDFRIQLSLYITDSLRWEYPLTCLQEYIENPHYRHLENTDLSTDISIGVECDVGIDGHQRFLWTVTP